MDTPAGKRWPAAGCDTGAPSAAILDPCAPPPVTGVEPSEGFLATARAHLAGRVACHRGRATAIAPDDASVDAVLSGRVPNVVADQRGALAQMAHAASEGSVIARTPGTMRQRWN